MELEWRWYDVVKRALDLVLSASALLVLAPLLVVLVLLISVESPGGVFYRGERVGRHGHLFRIWKLRTMRVVAEGPTSTAADDPRITVVGAWLRRLKLDELPQLINILVGEMSVVGPRPQVQWAVDTYSPEDRQVLLVRPGLTDWASIRFRNEDEILRGQGDPDEAYMRLIHPEKTRLGLEYVRRRSLSVDLQIIGRTLVAVVKP